MDGEFAKHLAIVKDLLAEDAEVLPPVALGSRLPPADAVVFPQLIGDAFSQLDALKRLPLPALVLTSDFGTVNMWDWEIVTFMKSLGMKVFTPYDLALTRTICRSLALRREMREVKFLVFQDRPGVGGEQPEIFKRFWWWEDRANEVIREKFGIRVVRKSFERLGAEAKAVSDADARDALKRLRGPGRRGRGAADAVGRQAVPGAEARAGRRPGHPGRGHQLPQRVGLLRHHAVPRVGPALPGAPARLGVRGATRCRC